MSTDAVARGRRVLAQEAEAQAEKLEGLMLQITRKTGVDGRLFGSVTTHDIVEALVLPLVDQAVPEWQESSTTTRTFWRSTPSSVLMALCAAPKNSGPPIWYTTTPARLPMPPSTTMVKATSTNPEPTCGLT